MIDEAKQCPACLFENASITRIPGQEWDKIECPQCGPFEMSGFLVRLLRKRDNLTLEEMKYVPYLSAYIHSETQAGKAPRLEDTWSAYVREWHYRQHH
jgi:hypothetical protein